MEDRMNIFRSPVFETKIIRGVFLGQDLVVHPSDDSLPLGGEAFQYMNSVIKYLFGNNAIITKDYINGRRSIRITNADYVLDNVKTLNAEWTCRRIEE